MDASGSDRLLGLVVFLPVPLVLWLFTRAPLGAALSLGVGTLVMLTHRLYARPFARRRAARRCLWCGGAASGPALAVEEPGGPTEWRACSDRHAERSTRFLRWAEARALALRAGILGTLAAFLGIAGLAAAGLLSAVTHPDAVALFRLGIAATVLPLGWLSTARAAAPAEAPPRAPFPLHIQALIGTAAVLWLFRLAGLWWLAAGLIHVGRRAGLLPA
jgi:hypothetical protein